MRGVSAAGALFLAVPGAAAPNTPSPNIPYPDYANPSLWLCRGLHMDVDQAMGSLIDAVRKQAAAFLPAGGRSG